VRAVPLKSPYSLKRVGAEKGRAGNVSTYPVQPARGCCGVFVDDSRRPLHPVLNGMPVEVQVLQDRDVVLTELFQEERLALNWRRRTALV